jgi:hypothetical protein
MTPHLPHFDKECFFITPIGDEDSDIRRRADGVLEAIVRPAAEAAGVTPIRADRIGEGGQVNLQVIEHVCRAATAVADLTGANLNVYYEVGMRHTTRLPLVLIADESERDKLPFDILVQRTIFFSNDMNGVASCKASVIEQLHAGLSGTVDSPLDAAINIRQFQQGDAVERTLAELVTSVDGLSREVSRGSRPVLPVAVGDLALGLSELEALAEERSDDELTELCRHLSKPVKYIVGQSRLSEDELARIQEQRSRARKIRLIPAQSAGNDTARITSPESVHVAKGREAPAKRTAAAKRTTAPAKRIKPKGS